MLKANGEQAAAFKNIIDHSVNDGGNINHSEMKIEDVNGKCDYEKWQITSNTEIEPMKVASDVAFEDLPLTKKCRLSRFHVGMIIAGQAHIYLMIRKHIFKVSQVETHFVYIQALMIYHFIHWICKKMIL